MEDKKYTNADLGRDYVTVMSRKDGGKTGYNATRKRISRSGIDLPKVYREEGNLEAVEGIGKGIKSILELILEKGVEEAGKIFEGGRVQLRIPGRPLPKNKEGSCERMGRDGSPGFEDSIRIIEDR